MRLFMHQLRAEQLLFWRSREAAFFIFIFPLILFVLLASVYTGTYLAAALTSMVLVFALQVVVLWVLGKLLKDIPFPHRLGSFVLTTLLGCAAFAGLGLAATALIRSLEGSSGAINAVLLPMAFLSGGFGPTAHYPTVLRKIGDVLPLKYFVQLLYTVYLREKSLWSRPGALAVLAVWGVVGAVIAARRFRWEPVEG